MESLKIAIVDDLQADRNQLRESLHRCAKDLSLLLQTVEFESGELFLDALQTSCFDVVFLDIVMNGLDGMEVAAAIRQQNKDCLVVFVTTSKEYAVQSYREMCIRDRRYLGLLAGALRAYYELCGRRYVAGSSRAAKRKISSELMLKTVFRAYRSIYTFTNKRNKDVVY